MGIEHKDTKAPGKPANNKHLWPAFLAPCCRGVFVFNAISGALCVKEGS
jgi:hypothetical protein